MIDVRVCEVGLRDGLQLISNFFPTDQKLAWIRAEAAAGVREIEVTSFVPPKLVPQFVDAEEVVRESLKIPGLSVMALIPNMKGAERGFALGVHQLNFVMSVSKTHNLKNVRREREESIADLERIVDARNALPQGKRPTIVGGLSTAPGASGNIVMDDLVFMLDSMGLRTGIDLEKLISVRNILKSNLPGTELYGAVAKAGLPTMYRTADARAR